MGILTVNNNIIGEINLDRGVGQGDSNSCFLYNVAPFPIAAALAKSSSVKDLELRYSEPKITKKLKDGNQQRRKKIRCVPVLYADDIFMFISSIHYITSSAQLRSVT